MSGSTVPADNQRFILSTMVSVLPMLVIAAIAWGVNKQSVTAIQADVSKIATEVHGMAESQAGIDKRVTVLEENRHNVSDRLQEINETLKEIKESQRQTNENVLLLCERAGASVRCKR